MIDKQIIIDGTQCRYASFDGGNTQRLLCAIDDCFCDCYRENECYYKKWQRKEQECEELKKIINEAKNSKLDLNSFFAIEATVGEYQLELDQLNEDRIEALKQLEFVRTLNTVREAEIRKLTKTLTEIKEITEVLITITDEYDNCYHKSECDKCLLGINGDCQYFKVEQILQKISECEGNDE